MINVLLNYLLSNDLGASELAANFLFRIIESGSSEYLQTFSGLSEELASKAQRALSTLFDCHCARVRSRELLSLGTAVAAASAKLAIVRGHPMSCSDSSLESLFSSLTNLGIEAIERIDAVQQRHIEMLWSLLLDCSQVEYFTKILSNPRTFDLLVSCLRLTVSVLKTNASRLSQLNLVEKCVEHAVTVIARLCVEGGAVEATVRTTRILESLAELFTFRPSASSSRVLLVLSSLSIENSDILANFEGLLGKVIASASKIVTDFPNSMGQFDSDAVHIIVSLTSNLLRTSFGMSNGSVFLNEFRIIAEYLTKNSSAPPDFFIFSLLSLSRLVAMILSANTIQRNRGDKVLIELCKGCIQVTGHSHDAHCIEMVSSRASSDLISSTLRPLRLCS